MLQWNNVANVMFFSVWRAKQNILINHAVTRPFFRFSINILWNYSTSLSTLWSRLRRVVNFSSECKWWQQSRLYVILQRLTAHETLFLACRWSNIGRESFEILKKWRISFRQRDCVNRSFNLHSDRLRSCVWLSLEWNSSVARNSVYKGRTRAHEPTWLHYMEVLENPRVGSRAEPLKLKDINIHKGKILLKFLNVCASFEKCYMLYVQQEFLA